MTYGKTYKVTQESEKHGEPRNHVPEEGSESEEGWLAFHWLFSQLNINLFVLWKKCGESTEKYAIFVIML